MFQKDNFIHSTYAKKSGFTGKIAILKKDINGFCEHEGEDVCTEIKTFSKNNTALIDMSYDDVKKELTEIIC